ncbi:energy-coupling factor ABC transporter ATP-binding protein [Halorubellus salinus]|uniref:energy-coupling factor ABC transporter ATP-binding protein n=1 Tax=Halorubellus salinus TaxID=755309 RepID=UPI001D06F761|nr:ABC transporter ATP-binding protein [Halorubellus salinus]
MIVVDDVSYAHGDTRVLDEVSLSVDDGEFVVLAGANGAGKTTLVRQFNGLLEPDAGSVLVNGTPVHADLVAARAAVGMVFQDPRDQFVAATVDADVAFGPENLGVSRDAVSARVEDALAAVGMTGRGEERLDELSGGEQSRVAIAGALAMDPDYLVLDEPFASLDAPSRESVHEHLAALHADGTSVVVVTHDVGVVADVADRVVVLADGRVVREGSPPELRGELGEHAVATW